MNKDNCKGLTMIELVVALAIMSGISFGAMKILSFFRVYTNSIDVDECKNSIVLIVTNGQKHCLVNKCDGKIYFDRGGKRIYFEEILEEGAIKKRVIEKYYIPNGFNIDVINISNNNIYLNINYRGNYYEAGTISFIDRLGVSHKITFGVGSTYVNIKE